MGRGLMGDGYIELPRISALIEQAGYHGPIEVEIFNQTLWQLPDRQPLNGSRNDLRTCFLTIVV